MEAKLGFEESTKGRIVEEFTDYYLYRRVGYLLVKLLIKTAITPNQVTLFGFVLGSIGCTLLATKQSLFFHPLFDGVLFILFYMILDCTDGQLARLKKMSSPFGKLLDDSLDIVIGVALCIITIVYFSSSFGSAVPIVLAAGITGLLRIFYYDYLKDEFLLRTQEGYQDLQKDYLFYSRSDYDSIINGEYTPFEGDKKELYLQRNSFSMNMASLFGFSTYLTLWLIGLLLGVFSPIYTRNFFLYGMVIGMNLLFWGFFLYVRSRKKITRYE